MNFSKGGTQRLLLVPALLQQLVEVPRAGRGLGQAGTAPVLQQAQQLAVGQVGVGPDPGKVQDFPHAHAERPDVGFCRKSLLK